MTEITLQELKQIELNILTQVHEVCTAQGLRYSLCGGTLLGAVRHGGFIPWDDDIDILMPRPDYEALIAYCRANETPFRLVSHQTDADYHYLFAKACAPDTLIVEENNNRNSTDMGVYIDIFPIDGLAESEEQGRRLLKSQRFSLELLVAYAWRKFLPSRTRAWYYEPIRFVFYAMSRLIDPNRFIRKIERRATAVAFDTAAYAGSYAGVYRSREVLPADVYAQCDDMVFEGRTFRAMTQYDAYLKCLYGDYMHLPPKEQQVSHHLFHAYRR
ncbi:MAG: LicD family protein [Clostridiales bacterium]|nr:LicD family protein [Candidatus Cacconaster stercorequi]